MPWTQGFNKKVAISSGSGEASAICSESRESLITKAVGCPALTKAGEGRAGPFRPTLPQLLKAPMCNLVSLLIKVFVKLCGGDMHVIFAQLEAGTGRANAKFSP